MGTRPHYKRIPQNWWMLVYKHTRGPTSQPINNTKQLLKNKKRKKRII